MDIVVEVELHERVEDHCTVTVDAADLSLIMTKQKSSRRKREAVDDVEMK